MPAKIPEAPKVMDVTHPSNVQPSATSRPMLVPNRPMIAADPMIAQSAMDAITKGGQEKSAGDSTEVIASPTEPVVNRQEKTIIPDQDMQPADIASDVLVDEQPKLADATPAGVPPVDAAVSEKLQINPITEVEKPAEIAQDTDVATATDEHSDTADTEVANPLERSQSSFEVSDFDDDETSEDDALPEKTAEQKDADNIEKLIASRLYAVPIGRRAKRRARLILLTLFIVLLALLTFDLMLDMGFIKISGIPHTNFFSL